MEKENTSKIKKTKDEITKEKMDKIVAKYEEFFKSKKHTWQEFHEVYHERYIELVKAGMLSLRRKTPIEKEVTFTDLIRDLKSIQKIDDVTCYFCGEKNSFTLSCYHDKPPFKYHGICSNCGMSTPFCEDGDETIAIEKAMSMLRKFSVGCLKHHKDAYRVLAESDK